MSSAQMLGRLIGAAMSFILTALGWVVANNTPPLSGGHFAGVLLVLAGGLLFVRMAQVARASYVDVPFEGESECEERGIR